MLAGESKRDRAAPNAHVEHARIGRSLEKGEAALDEHLGLGARDQRPAVDPQRQVAKAPLTEDVRERLATGPPLDECLERAELILGDGPVGLGVQLGARSAERFGEEKLRVEPRVFDAVRRELIGGFTKSGRDGRRYSRSK